MNATDFIKQHGVDKAREVVNVAPDGATHLSNDTRHYVNADFKPLPDHIKEQLPELIVINDLKRVVESMDLIESNGGYEEVKDTFDFAIKHGMNDLTEFGSRLKQAIADYESAYSNDMGDDSHIENHVSPNCKTESQPVLIVERDNQIIERLKVDNVVLQAKVDELQAENKILNQAASTHLKNQMHFKKLYDALVEQLYPYALDLNEQPNFSFKNCSHGYRLGVVAGYKTASETASFEILEMLKGDEEYIRAQCGMLGGGGGSDE